MPPKSEEPSQSLSTITIRQVVAHNLRRARRQHGWDQAELCRRLKRDTGLSWSPTTLSAAEATWAGKSGRERHFDAHELVSLAAVLEIPIGQLFAPPAETPGGQPLALDEASITLAEDDDDRWGISPQDLRRLSDPGLKPDLALSGLRVDAKQRSELGPKVFLDPNAESDPNAELDPERVLAWLYERLLRSHAEGGEGETTQREEDE